MRKRVSRLEPVRHCCRLFAFGCKSILLDEVFDSEGTASRTMSVNVSKNDIDRMVCISRSFKWNNEKMKVLFTRVDPILAHASSGSFQGRGTSATTPTSPLTNKRSHKPTTTQPRRIKTKLEDALITESDDMFALDRMESLDLQKPL